MNAEVLAELVRMMQEVRKLQYDLVRRIGDLGALIDKINADELDERKQAKD